MIRFYLLFMQICSQDILPDGVNCGSGNIFTEKNKRIINGVKVKEKSWNWESFIIIFKW